MGSLLIEKLRTLPAFTKKGSEIEIIAIGTNGIATASMLKAGADAGATGENPLLVNCRTADIIAGPIGITIADSLLGEITPAMAVAVGQSPAHKVLFPMNRCNNHVVGIPEMSMAELIQQAASYIEDRI